MSKVRGKVVITAPAVGSRTVAAGEREIRGINPNVPDVGIARIMNGSWRVTRQDNGTWQANYHTDLISGRGRGRRSLEPLVEADRLAHRKQRRKTLSFRFWRACRYVHAWQRQYLRTHPDTVDIDLSYGFSFVDDPRWFVPDVENGPVVIARWVGQVEIAARTGVVLPVSHTVNTYETASFESVDPHGMVVTEVGKRLTMHLDMPAWGTGINFTPYTEAEREYYE